MSIENHFGMYRAICDICGEELPPGYDFQDAVESKKSEGWKTCKVGEDFQDICCDCQCQ